MPDSSNNGDLASRVLSLEKIYYTAKAFFVVVGVVIVGFFGYTYVQQIPNAIDESIKEFVHEGTNKNLNDFIREVNTLFEQTFYIESGIKSAHHATYPDLRKTVGVHGERGAVNERVKFNKPFKEIPEVVVALSFIDHVVSDRDSNIYNLRIKATVTRVDRHGFNYSIATWADTDIWRADMSWIAYGYTVPGSILSSNGSTQQSE